MPGSRAKLPALRHFPPPLRRGRQLKTPRVPCPAPSASFPPRSHLTASSSPTASSASPSPETLNAEPIVAWRSEREQRQDPQLPALARVTLDPNPVVEATSIVKLPQSRGVRRRKARSSRRFVVAACIVLLAVIAASVAAAYTKALRGRSAQPSHPSESPPSARYAAVKTLLESAAQVTFPNDDPSSSSPQYRALAWVADEDGRRVPLEDVDSLVQRFALASLYFATGGERSWLDTLGFLSSEHECDWNAVVPPYHNWPEWYFAENYDDIELLTVKGVIGRNDTEVDGLWLVGNNVTGMMPEEIGLLSGIKELRFSTNELEGQLPDSLGKLSELERLLFSFNNLVSGTIPPWIGELAHLKEMRFDGTLLEGSIPSFFTTLPALEVIDFGPACLLNGTLPAFGENG